MSDTSVEPSHIDLSQFGRYREGDEVKTYHGGCHCGKFGYEFGYPALDVQKPSACNCSWCTRTGAIYAYVPLLSLSTMKRLRSLSRYGPEAMLKLDEDKAPLSALSSLSNKANVVNHYFCPACGQYLFWIGKSFMDGKVGVNVRNFDGMKLEEISWSTNDGRSL